MYSVYVIQFFRISTTTRVISRNLKLGWYQCCSCHATQVHGVLPGRSNCQQSPAGPVNMRRNMRRVAYSWGRQSQFWVEIGAVYNVFCKPQSCRKQKYNYSTAYNYRPSIWERLAMNKNRPTTKTRIICG